MHAVGPPSPRQSLRAAQQQPQTTPPGDRTHPLEQRASLDGRKPVMPEHHARSARQPFERAPQGVSHPFVGHQEEARQRAGLAGRHPRPYRRAMPETEALHTVRAQIAHAAELGGRPADAATLIAISKTVPAERILPLLEAGQRDYGENRVQEAQAKWPELRARFPDVRLHLVGQLQSNKAADAVALFDTIHSVDRSSLVAALARAMETQGKRPDCFLQVNIGDEEQKGGVAIAELPALLDEARAAGLPIVGLMAVPPADTEPAPYFALLAKLAREHGLSQLSMGMSGDYETAALIGATHIRVGTALFGARR